MLLSRHVPSLLRNISWAFVGQAGYAGTQWAMIVGMAHIASSATVGIFSLALAVSAPAFMLASLQLSTIQATDAASTFDDGHYLGVRIFASTVALAVCAILALGYTGEKSIVLFYVALAKVAESLSDVPFGLLQKREHLRSLAVAQLAKGVLSTVALLATLYQTSSLATACLALAVARLLSLVFIDVPLAGTGARALLAGIRFDRTAVALFRLALPLGFAALLQSLQANVPRYILDGLLGPSALGIFAALAYTFVAGSTVVQAIGRAAAPRFAKLLATGRLAGFRRLSNQFTLAGVLASGLLISVTVRFGADLLRLLYGAEYAVHAGVFSIMVIGACCGYLAALLRQALTAARVLRGQVSVLIVSTIVTAACAIALTDAYGLAGAAAAVALGGAVQLAGNHLLLRSFLRNTMVVVSEAT